VGLDLAEARRHGLKVEPPAGGKSAWRTFVALCSVTRYAVGRDEPLYIRAIFLYVSESKHSNRAM